MNTMDMLRIVTTQLRTLTSNENAYNDVDKTSVSFDELYAHLNSNPMDSLMTEITEWMESRGFDVLAEEPFCWDCVDDDDIQCLRFIHRIYTISKEHSA